ncbi:outer membrane beta-barrel protein [Pseudochryseolinea flava]|uniref:Outer membrane protein beta-barrel domain-containing protein n=1 Tax=Pseudochryseolinea flava TaxID=2059302 RepID=A0A364Y8N9_9BACT|nr:outer membrane beta-barrel protein [Pseudochryseolinea flava]RAW03273.1 hypothetical protein DQQ10_04090 [Pseudochryseolinea flava]
MKQLLCIALLLMVVVAVNGQTAKGSKALGGGISYSKDTYTGPDGDLEESELSFAPSFGYFVGDKFLLGLNLEISQSTEDEYPDGETKETGFAFGPFARYYIHTSNEQFAFFGQASIMFGSTKESYDGVPDDVKGKVFDINVAPGFAYFFNEHWALELGFRGIGFTSVDPNTDVDDDDYSSLQIGLNSLSPSMLGIRYHF